MSQIKELLAIATRAAIELDAASRFIKENNLEDMTVDYDNTTCDGYCLADECASTAEQLKEMLK